MDFYLITLKGIEKTIIDSGYSDYAEIVNECIDKWISEKDCEIFLKEFSPNGRFAGFRLEGNKFAGAAEAFWTARLLSALIAMDTQLARFNKMGQEVSLKYIREHFGHVTEVITGSTCTHCGYREIGAPDVDKYISGQIISKAIIHGLEEGDLSDTIESIMKLTSPRIERERERTRTRIVNSKIPYADTYGKLKKCLLCGNNDIKECRYLKSVKANVFVPLGIKK